MLLAFICNRNENQTFKSFLFDRGDKGISLDQLTHSHDYNTNIEEAYHRAMSNRFVDQPHLLTLIDPQEVILHRIIGDGTFGRVWSAKWGSSGVAVKEFVFAQAAIAGKSMQQQAIVEEIIGEAGMMAILRHPNVLQLFGCSLTSQAIWIVSELCSLGSLRQLLDDRGRTLLLEERLNLALQVAEGMTYLHSQDPPIIHRDLKSHNIFVHETFADIEKKDKQNDTTLLGWPIRRSKSCSGPAKSPPRVESESSSRLRSDLRSESNSSNTTVKPTMVAKIGDWGSARATLAGSKTMTHGVGTACWMAPEVLKHARHSKFSDVYGFGIILWELATRREVYEELESTQIIAMVANDRLRPDIPAGCPWNALMVKCWMEEPLERPTFDEIVKELNRLRPTVKKSTFTGEELQVPKKWKSYQKGAMERRDSDPKNRTG
jgi:serine/threonine protein kinase